MKQNTGAIPMEFSKDMKTTLHKILSYEGKVKKPVGVVIETGTYYGEGSTKGLAIAIVDALKEIPLYTLEANIDFYKVAKENLAKYDFVQPLYGLSLSLDECLDFITNDEAIINHELYPDIFIDDIKNPVFMYRTEVWAPFSCHPENPPMQNLLPTLIEQYGDQNPLIVLDSAGGIGLLEFTKVKELMGNRHYYLLCDDKAHLKHFRTYEEVSTNDKWKILVDEERAFLAEFKGKYSGKVILERE